MVLTVGELFRNTVTRPCRRWKKPDRLQIFIIWSEFCSISCGQLPQRIWERLQKSGRGWSIAFIRLVPPPVWKICWKFCKQNAIHWRGCGEFWFMFCWISGKAIPKAYRHMVEFWRLMTWDGRFCGVLRIAEEFRSRIRWKNWVSWIRQQVAVHRWMQRQPIFFIWRCRRLERQQWTTAERQSRRNRWNQRKKSRLHEKKPFREGRFFVSLEVA